MKKWILMMMGASFALFPMHANNEKEISKAIERERKEAARLQKQKEFEAIAAQRKDVTGYWFMHDYHKVRAGIAYLYEYNGTIYGRTLVTIDPDTGDKDTYNKPIGRARNIPGNPFTVGMEVIWVSRWHPKRRKWVSGNILDPRRRRPFNLDMWREGTELKLFGNIGAGIGATVTWHRATAADLPKDVPVPDVTKFVPQIYY
ncbi:MAG: DUF2147 domain-containing protein [Spirochaetia bacterium]